LIGPYFPGKNLQHANPLLFLVMTKIPWGDYCLPPFLACLSGLKKNPEVIGGRFVIHSDEPAAQAARIFEQI